MSSQEWKLPLNLAITFHVLIALATIYLPGLLDSKPKFEDIYTVNLVNLADTSLPSPPAAENIPATEQAEETVSKEAVSIAPPVPVAPVAAPPKAISLKPSKRKVKNEDITPDKPQQDLSQLRREKLAEAIRAEQEALEEARILAEEANIEKRLAEAAERRLAQVKSSVKTSSTSVTQPRNSGNSEKLSALETQYSLQVKEIFTSLWSLPEYRAWSANLKSTLVITVNNDGTIANIYFERKSGDIKFDNEVDKTIGKAGKLPPFPPAMRASDIELGLNFTPGGIHSRNR